MKKAEDLKKSRYGRISSKRKFNEELDLSLAAINNMSNGKRHIFNVGDMVWAKTGKYPVWPGIVITDPETNKFSKNENMVPMLHIYYCNDAYKRNWIKMKQISKFSGKEEILTEIPKITTQISRSKLKIKWNQAVEEAECLAAMNKDQRISSFFANNFLASNSQLTNKAESSAGEKAPIKQPSMLEKNVGSDHEQPALVNDDSEDHPRNLIPELCRQFYANGWVTGTGGGISIKYNDQIFIAPSGVQKERIQPDDLFVQNLNGEDVIIPKPEKKLSKSQCTPIFMCSFTERNAGAVIHVHSQEVVKLCLLNPENEVKITGLEMIKGIYNEKKGKFYDNDEELIIPIIENSKYEKDLVDTFKIALKKYPSTSAVLVRNHGMYVWGSNWKTAKTQLECYEYLFKIAIFKKIHHV
ncbi:probable methylthioribulose-1-phosphate dehydratase isoform X2 [Acyrthosiphon pisum]|uniref:Probable methylthioribulose-1-phosphate dehydratase n=1 Tax=Acyrthosiphon pisum TaxID=7029 RepID=A0A8R2AAN1_ACYPI|nr:probable methylthioribulose-1-phosphate dehydratase isoform X2 [Acyrthosiphon pisum]|eukprot:XP_001949266.2 PREDICTED: probable methylthioribulose-1-phosphate dehydratase isoform X2 [Acyrthosiphon pisum]